MLFNDGCLKCKLAVKNKGQKTKIGTFGRGKRGIMFVGERPDVEDDRNGVAFSGKNGKVLKSILTEFGVDVDRDCVFTYACRCWDDGKVTNDMIEECRKYLLEDIEMYQPKVIFLCGEIACKSYLNNGQIYLLRGNVIPEKDRWIVPLNSIDYVMKLKSYDVYMLQLFINDIERGLVLLRDGCKPDYIDVNEIKYKTIKAEELFEKIIQKIVNEGSYCVFDFETVGKRPEVLGSEFLCVGLMSDVLKKVYIVDKRFISERVIYDGIGRITENKDIVKICQNLKFEMAWVKYKMKKKFVRPYDDTMLMSYVLDERVKTNGLKWLAWVNFGVKDYSKLVNVNKIGLVGVDDLHRYNAYDVFLTYKLWEKFNKQLQGKDRQVYKKLLLKSVPLLVGVEYRGCGFDVSRLEELRGKYINRIEGLVKEIYSMDDVKRYGKLKDLDSPKQVGEFLFGYLKLPVVKTTAGGQASTDVDVLEKLKFSGNKFVDKLLEYRHVAKIYNTYLKKFDEYVINGRIKSNYWLVGTVTGRLSSDEPNLQNLPRGEFVDIRTMFVPLKKNELILSCDYSQWEVRVLQMYVNDKLLGKVITEGLDMHKKYAMKIFDVDEQHPRFKEYRQATKGGFVFATMYGAGHKTLTEYFWDMVLKERFKSFEVAKEFMGALQNEFFEDYIGIKEWIERLRKFYAENGYIETLFGRKRRAPIKPTQLMNSPVQSVASDFTLLSAQRVYKDLGLLPVLMIHDDLTYSVPEKEWKEYYKEIKKRMTDWDFDFVNVPIDVEAKVGERWGEQKVVEE
jgi:uracil-DNA glycosylase family 4